MPGIAGLEVCSRLKATPGLESLKIVMCTSKSFEFDRRPAAEIGADVYIVKPIKEDLFFETLGRVLASGLELIFWAIRSTIPALALPHSGRVATPRASP